MITIKENTYKQPTEVREEVVQMICDAFLNGYQKVFHPKPANNKGYRNETLWIVRDNRKGTNKTPYFWDRKASHQDGFRIRGCEMERAFDELIKAGYYMFRVYEYGTWMGYICSEKPENIFYERAERVSVFNDFID